MKKITQFETLQQLFIILEVGIYLQERVEKIIVQSQIERNKSLVCAKEQIKEHENEHLECKKKRERNASNTKRNNSNMKIKVTRNNSKVKRNGSNVKMNIKRSDTNMKRNMKNDFNSVCKKWINYTDDCNDFQ